MRRVCPPFGGFMTLYIRTKQGNQYHIEDTGDIRRLDIPDFQPSDQWKMQGLVHVRHKRRVITLCQLRRAYNHSDVWPEPIPELLYKNGKPQWRVIDLDHGTTRVWGDGVVAICKL